jgi:Tol biopolymer transport system component
MPFDPARLTITGAATTLVQDAIVKPGGGVVLALSANGTLAYPRGPFGRRLVLTDSSGVDRPLGHLVAEYSAPRLSPDGRRLAVAIGSVANSDIWIYEMPNGPLSRLTAGGANCSAN